MTDATKLSAETISTVMPKLFRWAEEQGLNPTQACVIFSFAVATLMASDIDDDSKHEIAEFFHGMIRSELEDTNQSIH